MNFNHFQFPIFCFPFLCNPLLNFTSSSSALTETGHFGEADSRVQIEPLVKIQENSEKNSRSTLIEKLLKFHEEQVHHRKTHWSEEQDRLLQKLVQIQKLQWRQIPSFFKQRTQNMCYSRYRRISMGTKDRNWTKEQQECVIQLIRLHGEKWKFISSKMQKFTPKQIRERFLNYLRPNITKDDFTFEEDLKICEYVVEQGKHWRRMEEVIKGRSQGAIKGRFYSKLHKIVQQCYGK